MSASSRYLIRTLGSTLPEVETPVPDSSPPPFAASTANWRAASQFSGPCPDNARDRSPNSGMPANGSIDSPGSSWSAMPRCYGLVDAVGTSEERRGSAASSVAQGRIAIVRAMDGRAERTVVVLTGAGGPLGRRVAAACSTVARSCSPTHPPTPVVADAPVESVRPRTHEPVAAVVDLGSSDYDNRAARRESATESAAATLAIADRRRGGPRRVRLVGAGVRRGGEQPRAVDRGRRAAPGRRVRVRPPARVGRGTGRTVALGSQPGRTTCVLRPAVALAAGRQLAAGDGAGVRVRTPTGRSRPAVAVPPSRRPGSGGGDRRRPPPRRCLQRGPGRLGARRAGPRALGRASTPAAARTAQRTRRRVCGGGSCEGRSRPACLPYTLEPWVVSNGRLRAAGWAPTVTNEQTYVESTEAPWWAMVSPKRRQELALGGGVLAAGRRRTRRRGRRSTLVHPSTRLSRSPSLTRATSSPSASKITDPSGTPGAGRRPR